MLLSLISVSESEELLIMADNGSSQVISNLEYDLLTVLQNKSEALQAYDKYIQDAQSIGSQPCVELFQKLQQADSQQAQEIRQHLQEVMQKGKM
jgi:rubrerythrin